MKKIIHILIISLLFFIVEISSTMAAKSFVHPGLPFTSDDLNNLKMNITKEPWLSGYNAFQNDAKSKLTYSMQGPFATVTRSPDLNNGAWKNDMVAVHNLTFMWIFTGNAEYAAKATQILDSWAVTNTSWGGGENMLDIGDYAPYFVTAADILKSTFPGWTADHTAHVNNYFEKILYPASWVPAPLRDCNKGAIQLQIALSIAAFLDDEEKWNQAIEVYRMDAGGGLRNSLPSGQVGDTGRDDHWFGQIWALAWGAEVAFKQGVDLFAEFDNRLLAIGELYNHYAIDPKGLSFTNYGGYSVYWMSGWGIASGARHQHPFNNIIHAAYSERKGISTPYTDQMRALVGEGAWSFLYYKSSDISSATPITPIVYPSENAIPVSYFSNMDIGNTGMIGGVSYNDGIWTVQGAGNSASNSSNYTFKPIKGDVAIVAKIESNSISSAVSGLMIRESLSETSNYVSLNFNLSGSITVSGAGATASNSGYTHTINNTSWWLKLERVGNRVFAYHSQDGISWTNNALFIIPLPTDAYIGFYTASKNTSALNCATFSNVSINNTFAVSSPEINSAISTAGVLNSAFNFTVTATGTPTSFAATGLPTGLTLDAATGIITGTPTTVGKSAVLLEATNVYGTGRSVLVIDVVSDQAPVAINSLAASVVNSTNIKLTWSATANATSYSVKRSMTAGGVYSPVQSGITGTSFVDLNPAFDVNNYYVVTAMVGMQESAVSNEVFGSVPPEVVSNLVGISKDGQVDLSWNTAAGAATYKIKSAIVSGGPYTELASVSTTSYSDAAVTNGNSYYYVVSSMGNILESANSSEVFGVPGSSNSTWSATPTNSFFNLEANWVENALPANPAVLMFNTTSDSTLTNDVTGLVASRIQFNADAKAYTIGGNSIILKSDLVNNSIKADSLTMPVVLDGQLNVNAKNGIITLSGVVSGNGSILKTGTSALVLSGDNTYSGNTIIRGTTGYRWGSTDGIQIAGVGTGTSGTPISGPLGTGKVILEGGALYTGLITDVATIYNDIEVPAGKSGYFYERKGNFNIYGRLLGGGSFFNDGSDNYACLSFYGDNSGFTGTFVSKLRSGNHRLAFAVPQAGSANAAWNLDASGVDCHRIMFSSGTLEFGSLTGRGGFRCNVVGTPIIRIGALNTNTTFSGAFANAKGSLSIEKVGTGTLIFTGNSSHSGNTTIFDGTLLLNTNASTGSYKSPVIANAGAFGGTGKSTNAIVIGTGVGAGAAFVPGTDGSVGTFTTTALTTLNADATLKIDMNSDAVTSDKFVANGIVLNNPLIAVANIGSAPIPVGTSFLIADNTSANAVSGTFKDLAEFSSIVISGVEFKISYKGGDGNDIVLFDNRTSILSSNLNVTASVNAPFSYSVVATNSPVSYSITGLPAGLIIDPATGIISGTPLVGGSFPSALSITNTNGTSIFTLTLAVAKLVQSIAFDAIPQKTGADADFTLSASASSGLTDITFTSSNLNVATIVGNTVHLIATGTCVITAKQAGNDVYQPAQTQQSLTVATVTEVTSPVAFVQCNVYPNPVVDNLTIESFSNNNNGVIHLLNNSGQLILSQKISGSSCVLNLSNLPSGLYLLHINQDAKSIIKKIIKK